MIRECFCLESSSANHKDVVLQYKENPRLSLRALTELHNIDCRSPEVRSKDSARALLETKSRDCGEASGGISLPLRHITGARLPSIPERATRTLAIAELPSETEDPLPPSKLILPAHYFV